MAYFWFDFDSILKSWCCLLTGWMAIPFLRWLSIKRDTFGVKSGFFYILVSECFHPPCWLVFVESFISSLKSLLSLSDNLHRKREKEVWWSKYQNLGDENNPPYFSTRQIKMKTWSRSFSFDCNEEAVILNLVYSKIASTFGSTDPSSSTEVPFSKPETLKWR